MRSASVRSPRALECDGPIIRGTTCLNIGLSVRPSGGSAPSTDSFICSTLPNSDKITARTQENAMTTEPAMARDSNDGGDTAKSKRKLSGIRKWPEGERPRERLLSRSPHALTDADLLAILLHVGGEGGTSLTAFIKLFKDLVNSASVPEALPSAVPWEELGDKVPARARKIRGKLNVPRERFRLTEGGEYVWAGKK
jgi:UPF0758 N-terminal